MVRLHILFLFFPALAAPFALKYSPTTGTELFSIRNRCFRTEGTVLNAASPNTQPFRYGRVQTHRPPNGQSYSSDKTCKCCCSPIFILFMQERNGETDSTGTNKEMIDTKPTSTQELSPTQSALIGMLKGYKALISPLLPPSCRFLPTCSEYSMAAIAKLGPTKGAKLKS
jgi:hypothetical protein